jgi:hypothetical protein
MNITRRSVMAWKRRAGPTLSQLSHLLYKDWGFNYMTMGAPGTLHSRESFWHILKDFLHGKHVANISRMPLGSFRHSKQG